MPRNLQNRIATSRNALPVTLVFSALLWFLAGVVREPLTAIAWAIFVFCAWLMAELNNRNALLRVYSRMIACAWCVLTLANPKTYELSSYLMIAPTFILYLTMLFRAYQERQAQGAVFFAFLFLTICCIRCPIVAILIPLSWILMRQTILCWSARNFFASLLGILTPLWFIAAYFLCTFSSLNALGLTLQSGFAQVVSRFDVPQMLQFTTDVHVLLPYGLLILFFIPCLPFLLRNLSADKMRTQMLYRTLLILICLLALLTILYPQQAIDTFPPLAACIAPIIGYAAAHAHARMANLLFRAALFLSLFATVAAACLKYIV